MAELLSANLDRIAAKVQAASDFFVFTDFDGTLVPIKDWPSECYLDPETKQTLTSLAHKPHMTVGVVSGRELEDLKTRIGIDHIFYAGNHGLEIEGPGFTFREPAAVTLIPMLQALANSLAKDLSVITGALIEDKKLSISVHYRKVDSQHVPRLIDSVRRHVAPAVETNQLVMKEGKKVLDIRPAVDWNKGNAVKWLTNKITTGSEPLTVYLGDDETDEDAFAKLSDQITICVGMSRKTMAKYATIDHHDVHAFMVWLLGIVGNAG